MNKKETPDMKDKLDAGCRMAFAAYLHDLGKFAERARIAEAQEKDADGNSRADINKQLYCPSFNGRYSHVHAAYTAMAIDLLEPQLPKLTGEEVSPFVAWKDTDADDSLINAAARHHRPDTFLQWIIATADRVASGFEREEFEKYNQAEEMTSTGRDHYTARLLTLFEQISLDGNSPESRQAYRWRYPLAPMSVKALFPVEADGYEHNERKRAQQEYAELWQDFLQDLKNIPASHRDNWSLWLDHFDSLWGTYTHAIPAATAGRVKPDVSLFDHSRTTAALATALWRFHDDRNDDPEQVAKALSKRSDWDEQKFLLVLGDFFGIQDFIFAQGGETQKNAARLLRGRSFQVSLLAECAALRILDELGLPSTSQVINSAGKFLIVAPATDEVREKLASLQKEFDSWFLEQTFGTSGIGLAWEPASCNDFLHGGQKASPFRKLLERIFLRMERMKSRRLDLCANDAPAPVMQRFWEQYDNDKGICVIDGRLPASEALEKATDRHVSTLAADQIRIGKWLGHHQRILITRAPLEQGHSLSLPMFGYHIGFTGAQEASGKFGALAATGQLRRAWDYALPGSEDEILFHGYARRHINAWIPPFGELGELERQRYQGLENEGDNPLAPRSLEHIARDDLWLDGNGEWTGSEGLMTLKGDVDNLGLIFETGLPSPSFARWASLSRQMNAFFAIAMPWYCKDSYPSTYTVFAGGDDFFLIGAWYSTLRLARDMRKAFARYTGHNPELHFSAGMVMTRPGLPIRQMGELAEQALERAKQHDGKDAVTAFGEMVAWQDFDKLWDVFEGIEHVASDYELATGYLYRLQELARMADNLNSPQQDASNAMWYSWFSYRTWRMLERTRGLKQDERKRRMEELSLILAKPIEDWGNRFRIPLFTHLYRHRH